MPPISILSAPPPPPPGGAPEPPAAPGAVPRLSLSISSEKAPPPLPGKGLNLKVAAEAAIKAKGKPPVKMGKPGVVLRKRPALGPVAKAGIAAGVVAVVVAGVFFYRIFFPAPGKIVAIELQPVSHPVPAKEVPDAAALAAKAAADAAKEQAAATAKIRADKEKADAAASQAPLTPTPETESVMAQSSITTDVKVNNTHLDAAPAASPAFRTFVAGASIGGVFQGTPSRALINGTIVREGQSVEGVLGITFDRIDSVKKIIYFKDSTGAEVSKSY
jgi:hypothetical protein